MAIQFMIFSMPYIICSTIMHEVDGSMYIRGWHHATWHIAFGLQSISLVRADKLDISFKPLILPDLDVCPTFHRFRYEKMMCAGSIIEPSAIFRILIFLIIKAQTDFITSVRLFQMRRCRFIQIFGLYRRLQNK